MRGGARQGAGRKKGPPKVIVSFYLSADVVERLPRDRSALVEKLLRGWITREERLNRAVSDADNKTILPEQEMR